MPNATVRFDRVSKRFRRGAVADSLRDWITATGRRLLRRAPIDRGNSRFWALREVSFQAAPGEALGIIGPNGAGKSTALKLLAGILRPEEGSVRVAGRVAALIEVGAGFHGDLTGRENVFLSGAILGLTRAQVRQRFDDVVAFAGLERFIDMPVKHYSSGMYARLGFSVAAHVNPDVLLVDEVLSVGDAMFRLRCLERMRSLVAGGVTLIFVTHQLEQMQAVCSRALVLDQGRAAFLGAPGEAVARYYDAMSRAGADRATDVTGNGELPALSVVALTFRDARNHATTSASSDEPLTVECVLDVRRTIARAVVELNMRRWTHENLVSVNSGRSERAFTLNPGRHALRLRIESLPVGPGQYFWNLRAWNAASLATELDTAFQFPLVIQEPRQSTGLVQVDHAWEHEAPACDIRLEPRETPGLSGSRITDAKPTAGCAEAAT